MNHNPEITLLHSPFPHYIWAALIMCSVQYQCDKNVSPGHSKLCSIHFYHLASLRSHEAWASLPEGERPCGEGKWMSMLGTGVRPVQSSHWRRQTCKWSNHGSFGPSNLPVGCKCICEPSPRHCTTWSKENLSNPDCRIVSKWLAIVGLRHQVLGVVSTQW